MACIRSASLCKNVLPGFSGVLSASVCSSQTAFILQRCSPTVSFNHVIVRTSTFFNRHKGEQLWDSVSTVSSQGAKRGRAAKKKQNLNLGQKIGFAKSGVKFPGLSTRINVGRRGAIQGMPDLRKLDKPQNLEEVQEMQKFLESKRDTKQRRKSICTPALERGYSGSKIIGKKLEPPDPVDGYEFHGFQTVVLQTKLVNNVTATMGNVRQRSILVAVGNGNGLAGFAFAKGQESKAVLKSAKAKAGQKLIYLHRYEDRTLHHNFSEVFHRTKVRATRKHKGHGIVCHRVLKSLCELFGIKDIHIKAEGSVKNTLALTKAFFNGIQKQKTYGEIANKFGGYVVECKADHADFPEVKAKPNVFKKNLKEKRGPFFNFDHYSYGNRVPYIKKKKFFYENQESFKQRQFSIYKTRNQHDTRIERQVMGLEKGITFD